MILLLEMDGLGTVILKYGKDTILIYLLRNLTIEKLVSMPCQNLNVRGVTTEFFYSL